jgi:uncharacterized membrane protein YedE/YeeE
MRRCTTFHEHYYGSKWYLFAIIWVLTRKIVFSYWHSFPPKSFLSFPAAAKKFSYLERSREERGKKK